MLNCQPHDLRILVSARLLKPLGIAPPNSVKFFAASELLELVKDRAWLAKVTNGLNQHWQVRNAARKTQPACSSLGHGPYNGLAQGCKHSGDGNRPAI